ncbi:MAG: leucine-rich repeat protein, partial [Lachnospiraceae bacterium]|nr:leucine-rich repeat protein [Lachnospiraceae bacterium]
MNRSQKKLLSFALTLVIIFTSIPADIHGATNTVRMSADAYDILFNNLYSEYQKLGSYIPQLENYYQSGVSAGYIRQGDPFYQPADPTMPNYTQMMTLWNNIQNTAANINTSLPVIRQGLDPLSADMTLPEILLNPPEYDVLGNLADYIDALNQYQDSLGPFLTDHLTLLSNYKSLLKTLKVPTFKDYFFSAFVNGNPIIHGSCGKNVSYKLDWNLTFTVSGTGSMDENGFAADDTWCISPLDTMIRDVVIEEGVTGIPGGAFAGCSNIRTISLPSTLESIGENAFDAASQLTSAAIAATVAPSVSADAFYPYGCAVPLYVPAGALGYGSLPWSEFSVVYTPETSDISGMLDSSVAWTYNEEHRTLTITGNGEMSYVNEEDCPWRDLADDIQT